MNNIKFPLIDVAGPPKERGRQYGEQAHQQIARSIEVYKDTFSKSGLNWRQVAEIASDIAERLKILSPDHFEEVVGIAEGSKATTDEIVALNARTEIFYRCDKKSENINDGCTGAIILPEASANGHLLHATNWDWMGECLETTVVLRIQPETGPRILTMAEGGILARCGMNELGIAVSGNFLHCQHDGQNIGIPIPFARRDILRMTNLDAAMRSVMIAPRSFSNNVMICAIGAEITEGAEAYSLETTPESVYWVEPVNGVLVHANHFVSPAALAQVQDYGLKVTPSSLYRHRRVENYLRAHAGEITMEQLKVAFSDRFGEPESVCALPSEGPGGDTSCTVATVLMDINERCMWIAPRPFSNSTYTRYDF